MKSKGIYKKGILIKAHEKAIKNKKKTKIRKKLLVKCTETGTLIVDRVWYVGNTYCSSGKNK
jgi:hypothetical protein